LEQILIMRGPLVRIRNARTFSELVAGELVPLETAIPELITQGLPTETGPAEAATSQPREIVGG
jgi:hypothetical protein